MRNSSESIIHSSDLMVRAEGVNAVINAFKRMFPVTFKTFLGLDGIFVSFLFIMASDSVLAYKV